MTNPAPSPEKAPKLNWREKLKAGLKAALDSAGKAIGQAKFGGGE